MLSSVRIMSLLLLLFMLSFASTLSGNVDVDIQILADFSQEHPSLVGTGRMKEPPLDVSNHFHRLKVVWALFEAYNGAIFREISSLNALFASSAIPPNVLTSQDPDLSSYPESVKHTLKLAAAHRISVFTMTMYIASYSNDIRKLSLSNFPHFQFSTPMLPGSIFVDYVLQSSDSLTHKNRCSKIYLQYLLLIQDISSYMRPFSDSTLLYLYSGTLNFDSICASVIGSMPLSPIQSDKTTDPVDLSTTFNSLLDYRPAKLNVRHGSVNSRHPVSSPASGVAPANSAPVPRKEHRKKLPVSSISSENSKKKTTAPKDHIPSRIESLVKDHGEITYGLSPPPAAATPPNYAPSLATPEYPELPPSLDFGLLLSGLVSGVSRNADAFSDVLDDGKSTHLVGSSARNRLYSRLKPVARFSTLPSQEEDPEHIFASLLSESRATHALPINASELVAALARREADRQVLALAGVTVAKRTPPIGSVGSPRALVRAEALRRAFEHAYALYERRFLGDDVLKPLTQTSEEEHCKMSLTLVDTLDTALLMGLAGPYVRGRAWLERNFQLKIGGQSDLSLFECSIRIVGGLESLGELSGDKMFHRMAEEVLRAFVDAGSFASSSGFAYGTLYLVPREFSKSPRSASREYLERLLPQPAEQKGTGSRLRSAVDEEKKRKSNSSNSKISMGHGAEKAPPGLDSYTLNPFGASLLREYLYGGSGDRIHSSVSLGFGNSKLPSPSNEDIIFDRTIVQSVPADSTNAVGFVSRGGRADVSLWSHALQPKPQATVPPLSGFGRVTTAGHAYNPLWAGGLTSMSESTTLQLEFLAAARASGNLTLHLLTDRVMSAVEGVGDPDGLFSLFIDPDRIDVNSHVITLGARVDSLYEYLMKQWHLRGGWEWEARRSLALARAVIAELAEFLNVPLEDTQKNTFSDPDGRRAGKSAFKSGVGLAHYTRSEAAILNNPSFIARLLQRAVGGIVSNLLQRSKPSNLLYFAEQTFSRASPTRMASTNKNIANATFNESLSEDSWRAFWQDGEDGFTRLDSAKNPRRAPGWRRSDSYERLMPQELIPKMDHLVCFLGGTFGMAHRHGIGHARTAGVRATELQILAVLEILGDGADLVNLKGYCCAPPLDVSASFWARLPTFWRSQEGFSLLSLLVSRIQAASEAAEAFTDRYRSSVRLNVMARLDALERGTGIPRPLDKELRAEAPALLLKLEKYDKETQHAPGAPSLSSLHSAFLAAASLNEMSAPLADTPPKAPPSPQDRLVDEVAYLNALDAESLDPVLLRVKSLDDAVWTGLPFLRPFSDAAAGKGSPRYSEVVKPDSNPRTRPAEAKKSASDNFFPTEFERETDVEAIETTLQDVARGITDTCYMMYATTSTGLAPEIVTFRPNYDFRPNFDAAHSLLRPEALESIYTVGWLAEAPLNAPEPLAARAFRRVRSDPALGFPEEDEKTFYDLFGDADATGGPRTSATYEAQSCGSAQQLNRRRTRRAAEINAHMLRFSEELESALAPAGAVDFKAFAGLDAALQRAAAATGSFSAADWLKDLRAQVRARRSRSESAPAHSADLSLENGFLGEFGHVEGDEEPRESPGEGYRSLAWDIFSAMEKHARVRSGGYASLNNCDLPLPPSPRVEDVQSALLKGEDAPSVAYSAGRSNMRDKMESFLLSESFKYIFLAVDEASQEYFDLDRVVLNTEAHALLVQEYKLPCDILPGLCRQPT